MAKDLVREVVAGPAEQVEAVLDHVLEVLGGKEDVADVGDHYGKIQGVHDAVSAT